VARQRKRGRRWGGEWGGGMARIDMDREVHRMSNCNEGMLNNCVPFLFLVSSFSFFFCGGGEASWRS
jgi:hypothetical protein